MKGVTSAALERDMALQTLSQADIDARQTQVLIAATSERARALKKEAGFVAGTNHDAIRNSDNPQLMERMKARLLRFATEPNRTSREVRALLSPDARDRSGNR